MEKKNVFANIKSKDGKYEIKIGKPVHNRVNIIFNFNAVRYLQFVDHINSHEYVNVLSVHAAYDGRRYYLQQIFAESDNNES